MRLLGILAMDTPTLSPGPGPGWEVRRKQGSYFVKRELGGGTGRAGKEGRKEGGEGGTDGKPLRPQG